jgi:hypothetical protein
LAVLVAVGLWYRGGDGTTPPSEDRDGPVSGGVDGPTPTPGTEDAGGPDDADQPDDAVDGPVPRAVVAVQGPIEEAARYVSVTWSHVDLELGPDAAPRAIGYDIDRNGAVIGSTDIDDEPWDDPVFRDDQVPDGTATYRVRARFAEGPGRWSAPAEVRVLGSDDVGPVFDVDDQPGPSDIERAQRAVDAAEAAGGGIVRFGPRAYELAEALVVSGDGVLLRGAGADRTVLRPGFAGGDDPCGPVNPLVVFRGGYEELGVAVTETASRGDDSLRLDGRPPVAVGDLVEVDGVIGQLGIEQYLDLGIAVDPSTGQDERYPFEAGIVASVGDDTLAFERPLSPVITEGSELYRLTSGRGNGVELLTIEGRGPDDTTFYRLIDAIGQIDFRLSDVTARWANRNFVDVSGHGITIVGLTATEGGAVGYQPEPCKYKVGFGPATDVTMVDSRIGSLDHDENMSLVTTQFVYRLLVRNTVLGRSRTYGFNEHGGGSRDVVVENNWIEAGPSGWSGILLGNDTWGFGGETAIRNNRFVDNVVDVLMVENPYGVVIAGNRSDRCRQTCVTWSGWGGEVDGQAAIGRTDRYGSARLAIVANRFAEAANGIDLGAEESYGFPWVGVRDAIVADNVVESGDGTALAVRGDAASSGRLWVGGNRFEGAVEVATPGPDWWLWDNGAGPETARGDWPDWFQLWQPWELAGSSP